MVVLLLHRCVDEKLEYAHQALDCMEKDFPIGDQQHAWGERRELDVGATECVHTQCVLPVICRAQRRHRTSNPKLSFFVARQPSINAGMREA